jgi:hypothetical protein
LCPLPKKSAIEIGNALVQQPERAGRHWHVTGPLHNDRAGSANTTRSAATFHAAQSIRNQWVAQIALIWMGWDEGDTATVVVLGTHSTPVAIVENILTAS